MIQVIAEYPEVVVLEDEQGKFLFTQDSDKVIDMPSMPIINTRLGVNGQAELHREVRAMLH